MNKNVIFVNATSATVGGSLTILNQFIDQVERIKDRRLKYYIFVPIDCKLNSTNYYEIIKIKAKSYKDRIKWDLWGMKKWSKCNGIYPRIIISLQNTGVRFDDINQIIYLHQSLPYAKESKWNPLKKDERKMWFYKYIYKIWIDAFIKKEHYIVVQTDWMKQELIKDRYNENNIIVSKPKINKININEIETIQKNYNKVTFFYPAADYKYKNHRIIIDALKKIKSDNPDILNKIEIIFTISRDSILYQEIIKNDLENNFIFLGSLKYEDVLKYYKFCDVVLFPSYIETFGLPLIEAAFFGKKIIVSNCCYSREVLREYENSIFVEYNNVDRWSEEILKGLNPYIEKPKLDNNDNGWNEFFKLINTSMIKR